MTLDPSTRQEGEERQVMVRILNRLGLYATAFDVSAARRTPEQGRQHIADTIARGQRDENWNARARAVLESLRESPDAR